MNPRRPLMPRKPPGKVERYTATLRVTLTAAEVADRANRAAQLLADRDQKEEELKASTKHAKSVIEKIEAEMRLLSNEVLTRASWQPVDCERRYLYERKLIQEARLDTGEVTTERKMTA